VGRDTCTNMTTSDNSVEVSIHAPAWGATRKTRHSASRNSVSIHAPAWGATEALGEFLECFRVSIHAPAWGATKHSHCRS